ncbi:hypothetical protein K439DRAFT_314379 [Ramaria rubella]|nr:hypothetical protein K439DRAFT_314379 [Ramaria rubella]
MEPPSTASGHYPHHDHLFLWRRCTFPIRVKKICSHLPPPPCAIPSPPLRLASPLCPCPLPLQCRCTFPTIINPWAVSHRLLAPSLSLPAINAPPLATYTLPYITPFASQVVLNRPVTIRRLYTPHIPHPSAFPVAFHPPGRRVSLHDNS